jgi:hypothetical protein
MLQRLWTRTNLCITAKPPYSTERREQRRKERCDQAQARRQLWYHSGIAARDYVKVINERDA